MAEPTIQDIHIDKPLENVSVKVKQQKRNKIESVPIFQSGTWKGQTYTIEDLDEIVRNTNALIKARLHEPPIKLGHNENQKKLLEESGLPAFGYVEKLYRIGDQIFADFIDVPDKLIDWITLRHYDKVSSEIYLDYEHPKTNEKIGKVLRAVALLGADIPAVKGLGSIMYHKEDKQKIKVISFEDKNLEEVNTMMIRKWTIDEIKRVLPCCLDFVKKYMEEKKKDFLDGDELAMVLAEKRFQEAKEGDKKEETQPECPEGYKWDADLGKCVRLDEKQEDRPVCPKGYKWDEEQQRCVPIVEEKKKEKEQPEDKEQVEKKEEVKKFHIGYTLLKALLDKLGIELPEDEELPEDVDEYIGQKMKEKKEDGDEVKIEITSDEEESFYKDLENLAKVDKEDEIKKFQLPGGEPRGWTKESFKKAFESLGGTFTDCVEAVKDSVENPERFCAWMKYRATGKYPGTKEWRAEENVVKNTEDNPEMRELKNKIKEYENKLFKEKLDEFVKQNRNVLLPRFDSYIKAFTEGLSDKIVKFEDKEVDLRKLFLDFLKDIVESKMVKFGEIAKTPKEDYENVEITDKEKEQFVKKYSEIRPGIDVRNVELAILAEKIEQTEKIPYKEALVKAYEILNKKAK
jgi:hypothetical protein